MSLYPVVIFIFFLFGFISTEQPCLSRQIDGESTVCVCSANYCDTIETGPTLSPGQYRIYTSNEAGARFERTEGYATLSSEYSKDFYKLLRPRVIIKLDPETVFQEVIGFGGSITDSASINILKLSAPVQEHLLRSYYSVDGLEYNLMRIPIGGCDFSTHPYTLNDLPWEDNQLTNFSLAYEDYHLKIPLIRKILEMSANEVRIIAATWSPPVWMKTNPNILGFSQLKNTYYQTYADYHLRFLEEYENEGVKIWALTTTNEPINGIVPISRFNSLGWWPWTMSQWIVENFGPTIRNSKYNETKILAVDDQRYILPFVWEWMVHFDPDILSYVDGLSVHYYGNWIFPGQVLTNLHDKYPGLMMLATEACEGSNPWDNPKVIMGSWHRAERYILDIIENLNNWVQSWVDWNIALDSNGGPNWANNFVDSPIIVNEELDEFYKNPMFYAIGHFSKFIPRGSVRIASNTNGLFALPVRNVAFKRPDGTYVLILYSTGLLVRTIEVNLPDGRIIEIILEPKTIKTIEIQP